MEGGAGMSRGAVGAVRALAAAGYAPVVTSCGLSLAGASRYCARRVVVPSSLRHPEAFAAAVRAEASRAAYAAVLPCNDEALLALGGPAAALVDKVVLAERARSVGFPIPETVVFATSAELTRAAATLAYPVVVKPARKSYPALRAATSDELLRRLPRGDEPVLVQPYLDAGLRGILGLMHAGELVAAVHLRYVRTWPTPCGTAAAALTVDPDEALERRVRALLAGHEGIFHMDLAGPFLLDLNPRLHATLPLAAAAGVDLTTLYCDLQQGRAVPHARGRGGVFYRWLEGDVRSVIASLRARRISALDALTALRPRARTVHGFESAADPGPLLERARYVARRLLTRGAPSGRRRRPGPVRSRV